MFLLLTASGLAMSAPAETPRTLSKAEATRLAQQYFEVEIALEGALGIASIKGDFWSFPVKLGYAGTVQPDPLLVHRQTGKVSWAGLAALNARLGRTQKGVSK
jgi:hypothetical protein